MHQSSSLQKELFVMKIAYFGYDFFVDAISDLVAAGHSLHHVQTMEMDGIFTNRNERTLALAGEQGSTVGTGPVSTEDIGRCQEADIVAVMGYGHKLPSAITTRAINVHPTMLPYGKGPFPLPWLILRHPEHGGLTCHKITDEMDSGPILHQVRVEVSESEFLDSLTAKIQMTARPFLSDIVDDFDRLWNEAALPVEAGSYWKATEQDWTLPWHEGWEQVVRTVRAFGAFESTAVIDGVAWSVSDAVGWESDHSHVPGALVHKLPEALVVAASDGLVLLRSPVLEGTA
jgi:methionyl-tRNA formyltransferase